MIKQTAEIFEILSKGGFISSDSTNPNIRQLYTVIEDNQSELYDFFAAINFVLESGNEYYYFSRRENKVDLERKLEIAVRWIDVLDFIKTYDAAFSSGFRFQPADMVVKAGRVRVERGCESGNRLRVEREAYRPEKAYRTGKA